MLQLSFDMNILIREAKEKDTEELELLFQVTRQKTFTTRPPDEFKIGDYKKWTKGEIIFVAIQDGNIVGFTSIFLPNFIHNLFVYPHAQMRGVGTLLLQKAEEQLTCPMELKVALYNLKACPFYEKHGWKEAFAYLDAPDPYLLYRKE